MEMIIDFPKKYHDVLIRSADQCAVKKQIENPPHFNIYTKKTEKEEISV